MKRFSRRRALKGVGAAGAAAALGCGDDETTGSALEGRGEITHLVVVMMENRTYDHYFGARSLEGMPGDGLVQGMANPDLAGTMHPIYPETVGCVADPPHGWDQSRNQFNGGANDGFMRAYQEAAGDMIPPHVMGYYDRKVLPVSWALADGNTICDRWFSSVMGPTWPNRFYLHTGQSGGNKSNDPLATPIASIYDRLDAAGIAWSYHYADVPFLPLVRDIVPNIPLEFFFEDAKAGKLAPVTMIDPGFTFNDDHPPHHPLLGQQFIASIYQALATSPQWEKILFVVTYDEHGGFFDHVPPPKAPDERAAEGFDQLGFRVPTIIAGPWVKKGHVSSTQYDHTSVLKHIENMFGLEPLTQRDAAANDLSDAIDTERMAKNEPEPPIELPAVVLDESVMDPACMAARVKTDLEIAVERGIIPAAFDRRRHARDIAFFIGDYLAAHGKGGIRRGK